ncbi:hypothetical protein PVK06_035143 [Gossypium arboreum]|uniref:Uncharacterized protein n=1 Tax=Gossypium arboreum TaxID=29729 RepID=A0ABR0NG24_GOSAR|nr:hypothetical protein PVK06_035143 [Gossypium arboreum]
MVQGRCVDCRKKRDHSPSRLDPQTAKRVRSQLSVSKGNVEDSGSGIGISICGHCVCLGHTAVLATQGGRSGVRLVGRVLICCIHYAFCYKYVCRIVDLAMK